jgi:hypothetical protein
VSNTYYAVFLLCFSSPCVPYLPVSLDFPCLIAPSVFSNTYLIVDVKFFEFVISKLSITKFKDKAY